MEHEEPARSRRVVVTDAVPPAIRQEQYRRTTGHISVTFIVFRINSFILCGFFVGLIGPLLRVEKVSHPTIAGGRVWF
jgi:hypothetical protein